MAASSSNKPGWFARLSAERKRQLRIILVIVAFVAIVTPFLKPRGGGDVGDRALRDESIANVLTGADTKELGISGMSLELDQLKRQNAELKQQIDNKERPSGVTQTDPKVVALQAEVAELRRQIENPPPAPPTYAVPPQGTLQNPASPASPGVGPMTPRTKPRIRTFSGQGEVTAVATANAARATSATKDPGLTPAVDEETIGVYIPSGTMINGTLINGMDAPTGRSAMTNPVPVLVRIDADAILPNRFRVDVDACHALASGYGELSSERVHLRLASFSCVLADGSVIDMPLEAYATGNDGKAGLRGRLVSKQGQVLAKASIAAILDGVSRSLAPAQPVAYATGGVSLEAGAVSGASTALDRIAEYYLEQADQIFPVLELDAMKKTTWVVVKGTEIKLRAPR